MAPESSPQFKLWKQISPRHLFVRLGKLSIKFTLSSFTLTWSCLIQNNSEWLLRFHIRLFGEIGVCGINHKKKTFTLVLNPDPFLVAYSISYIRRKYGVEFQKSGVVGYYYLWDCDAQIIYLQLQLEFLSLFWDKTIRSSISFVAERITFIFILS